MPANQITYTITGQAQNRINQLMVEHSPRHSLLIWLASLSCLVIPMLVFGRSLSTITLSGLFGSSLITLFILKLALKLPFTNVTGFITSLTWNWKPEP